MNLGTHEKQTLTLDQAFASLAASLGQLGTRPDVRSKLEALARHAQESSGKIDFDARWWYGEFAPLNGAIQKLEPVQKYAVVNGLRFRTSPSMADDLRAVQVNAQALYDALGLLVRPHPFSS